MSLGLGTRQRAVLEALAQFEADWRPLLWYPLWFIGSRVTDNDWWGLPRAEQMAIRRAIHSLAERGEIEKTLAPAIATPGPRSHEIFFRGPGRRIQLFARLPSTIQRQELAEQYMADLVEAVAVYRYTRLVDGWTVERARQWCEWWDEPSNAGDAWSDRWPESHMHVYLQIYERWSGASSDCSDRFRCGARDFRTVCACVARAISTVHQEARQPYRTPPRI